MKVKELLEMIEKSKKEFPDLLEWDVALEHIENPEKDPNCKDEIIISKCNCNEKTKFIKSFCMGCCTYFIKKKILGLQIRY